MRKTLRDFYKDIASSKAFWMPLLFFTFGTFGFSMLHRTVGADDLATGRYVDGTIWLQELRWGAVLWKKVFSFGEYVPFVDKYLSACFLVLAATAFAALWYYLSGKRKWVLLYTVPACAFVTYPILQEIWEYTCGGCLIVPGDFFLTFLTLLFLLVQKKPNVRATVIAGLVLTLICSSAESLAPVYVAMVLMILYYKYCVAEPAPEGASCGARLFKGKAGWFFEGLSFAAPLALALVLRLVIGYGIMGVLNLHFQHTGATKIYWPLTGEELRKLIGKFLTHYVAAAFVYMPIGVFIFFAFLFILFTFWRCYKKKSSLPLFLGICVGLSLFFLTILQGMVMYYRTAITLMVFVGFCVFLSMELLARVLDPAASAEAAAFAARRRAEIALEDREAHTGDGSLRAEEAAAAGAGLAAGAASAGAASAPADGPTAGAPLLPPKPGMPARVRRFVCQALVALLLLLCWRQGIYQSKLLSLNNLRSENEAHFLRTVGYQLNAQFDKKPLLFVGNYDNGVYLWQHTTAVTNTWGEKIFYKMRRKFTGIKPSGSPYNYVQTDIVGGVDWYRRQFDGELMSAYLAYWGYDYDVISNLSDEEYTHYCELAKSFNMQSGQIVDMGDYILICIGRL